MPLHRKKLIAGAVDCDLYASHAMRVTIPKYKMTAEGVRPDVAFHLVNDELMFDGNARQNLATFCQTWFDDEIHKLMDLSIDKNMIDKDEYPATAEIEDRCVHIIANLWNAPLAGDTIGCSTTGSSEAAMLAGLALKWRWRQSRQRAGLPAGKPNIVTGPVQICWEKFARYFDVELREIPLERGRYFNTAEKVLEYVDENTIGVVCTFATTFTCQYEPVADVAAALDRLEVERGLDIPIHVDAASGGFVAPFIPPEAAWDFRLKRVHSINASGHKYGLAPLGVGWVVWREKRNLPDELIFRVNYLGGEMPTFALNFSRPGGQVICQYYLMLRLGSEGYRAIHENCYNVAAYAADNLRGMNRFDVIFDGNPRSGIPAVSWTFAEGQAPYSLFDLSDRLRIRGWQVPAYTLPKDADDVTVMRILVRHGFSRDMADRLLEDIHDADKYLLAHPQPAPNETKRDLAFTH
ncbi:MAG: glutamate decarboxylase [Candidatus Eremiobacteraeota bacterium]|nr:glutamate decarboxylase [Candidatus Eremiobacteraeota bacterium]